MYPEKSDLRSSAVSLIVSIVLFSFSFFIFQFLAKMYNNACGTSIDYQNKPLGILYICHGLLYYPFYIPCLIAISTKPLNSKPCYQIMTSMAVLDLVNLTISLICGYWSIIGFSYCGNVQFMKVFGAFIDGKSVFDFLSLNSCIYLLF